MSSNGSDSCSNGSIPAQRDEIARQLVEAATQCQDAPTVARQQAEAQSEIESIEVILDPFLAIVERWGELNFDGDYRIDGESDYRRSKAGLERPLEHLGLLAKATGNRALAKAVRQVGGALVATDLALRYGREQIEQRSSYDNQWYDQNPESYKDWTPSKAEKATLDSLFEKFAQAKDEAGLLLSKAKNTLCQYYAQAHVHLDRAQTRAAEIDAAKQRQTALQAAAHALAAIHRVPDAQEDEGGNGR